MSRKIRNTALAGLVLALAAGTTALAALSARQDPTTSPQTATDDDSITLSHSPCNAQGRCCTPIRKNPHAASLAAAAHKKTSKKKNASCQSPCSPCINNCRPSVQEDSEVPLCEPAGAGACQQPEKPQACTPPAFCISAPPCMPGGMMVPPPAPPMMSQYAGTPPATCPAMTVPFPVAGMMPQQMSYPGACGWMPPPGPMWYPCPTPEQVMAPPPPAAKMQTKQYFVEMKMIESRKGEKDRTVAMPKLTILAHEQGEFSCGTSFASLWQKEVPANDMGHEGLQIGVKIIPEQKDRVRLTCSIWTSELDDTNASDARLSESRCETTQMAKLGEIANVYCDRLTASKPVHCRLELTVKECPEEQTAPQTADVGCAIGAVCAQPRVQVGDVCFPFEGCRMIEPQTVMQLAHTEPVCPAGTAACKGMTITTIEVPCEETGKQGDLCGSSRQLEICCCGTKMTCKKTELTFPGCKTLTFHCEEDHVVVAGEHLYAMADSISTDQKGSLILEGHVHVVSTSGEKALDIEAGKVNLKIEQDCIIQTGVISNSSLIQN